MSTPRTRSFSELAGLAAKQHGLMTHAQAMSAGLSRTALSRLVRAGAWEVVLPRVFRRKAASQTEGQALMAACLCLGSGAVVSHHSAAKLLGLDVAATALEITTPLTLGRDLPGFTIHRSRAMMDEDRRELRGLPVTTAARTIIDLASCLEEDDLAILVEEAWRRRLAAPDWIARRLKVLGKKGRKTGALAEIVTDCRARGAPLESALEVRLWRLLKKQPGLSMPTPNYEFRDDYAQPGRIDFAYPAHRLAIECDGYEFHGTREAFERDRLRTARLAALGWRVMPVTRRHLDEERANVVTRLREALRHRTTPFV